MRQSRSFIIFFFWDTFLNTPCHHPAPFWTGFFLGYLTPIPLMLD
jgi:hypothetical protein